MNLADKCTKGILLEPRDEFDVAVVEVRKGYAVYSYEALMIVLMFQFDNDWEVAHEWLEYNIVGLESATTFRIKRDLP